MIFFAFRLLFRLVTKVIFSRKNATITESKNVVSYYCVVWWWKLDFLKSMTKHTAHNKIKYKQTAVCLFKNS